MPPQPLEITRALAPSGLSVRGVAPLAEGEWGTARAVVLVGNEGARYWAHFEQWRQGQPAAISNPLDTWSRRVISDVAQRFGGRVVMPNDRPYAPFQQWAKRAQKLHPSPVGPLIDPRLGLWHAYRGAILFDVEIPIQEVEEPIHACGACVGKFCINACPAHAFDGGAYNYAACLAHVRGPNAGECRARCIARNACPVGTEWRYPDEVQAFHHKAFAGL